MNKEIKNLYVVLIFFALAAGMFYNFQELWLAENNLSLATIGTVLSLGSVISVSVIFLSASIIRREHLKNFVCVLLLIKTVFVLMLYLLHGSGFNILIKLLTILDFAVNTEIYACIYPLITFVSKDDKLYALRGLIYDGVNCIVVIIISFLLGKSFGGIKFDYNLYCLLAAFFLLIASIILIKCNINKYYKADDSICDYSGFSNLFKKVKNDLISRYYIAYVIVGQISYYSIMGMLISILINVLNFSSKISSNLILVVGFLGILFGFLILKKLTLKNDYINLSIKFLIRFILYIFAFILNSKVSILAALLYAKFISFSYSHICDAPYINRFTGKDQMIFCNLIDMLSYFGRAIGTFICGWGLGMNIRVNFFIASLFIFLQIVFAFLALNLRLKEKEKANI